MLCKDLLIGPGEANISLKVKDLAVILCDLRASAQLLHAKISSNSLGDLLTFSLCCIRGQRVFKRCYFITFKSHAFLFSEGKVYLVIFDLSSIAVCSFGSCVRSNTLPEGE